MLLKRGWCVSLDRTPARGTGMLRRSKERCLRCLALRFLHVCLTAAGPRRMRMLGSRTFESSMKVDKYTAVPTPDRSRESGCSHVDPVFTQVGEQGLGDGDEGSEVNELG